MNLPIDLGRVDPNCRASWHGTESAFKYGCCCPHAKEARRVARKRRSTGRQVSPFVDATGSQRRIQALCAIGWTYGHLAERLGCTWQVVQQHAFKVNPTVHRLTARRVAALYRELSTVPGPSPLTRRRAAAKGWVTPIAWNNIDDPGERPEVAGEVLPPDDRFDEPLVRRAIKGEVAYRGLRDADRVEVYRRLVAAGATPTTIRNQLRINQTVFAALAQQATEHDAERVAA